MRSARWRRGWDSNPRTTCAVAGFQDRCDEPLCHPSACGQCSNVTSRGGSPGERHLAYCSAMTALFIACADGRAAAALVALQEKEGDEGGGGAAVGAGDEKGGHGGAVCQMALAGTTPAARDVATLATRGGVAERFIAPVLKTGNGASRSWVRIPPPPPAPGPHPSSWTLRGIRRLSPCAARLIVGGAGCGPQKRPRDPS